MMKARVFHRGRGLRCALFIPRGRFFVALPCAHPHPVGGSISLTAEEQSMLRGYLGGLLTADIFAQHGPVMSQLGFGAQYSMRKTLTLFRGLDGKRGCINCGSGTTS